ncbi:PEP-CTERM/exosortase system-associated acyltransferase [Uliginosibacterium sp. H3]|uniref:PEP-CTERM/exosortase system-associated acyltransferase n=1 Tax=Uliginosibacterium silvisoli TaxID=3114758 RepID=A0ABU6K859_9RHOO|nr:PEP-CTERM/exosortase system-associated acyltransferase [Uliginosibacterium sp. H3]
MFSFEKFNLGEGFKRHFEIVPALDEQLLNEVYAIRHSVYCHDLKYEAERDDEREMDAYDAQSVHCLLRTSNEQHGRVGCTRLVMTRPEDRDAPLPFEAFCEGKLRKDTRIYPRDRVAEVSRLAVVAAYRRRKGEDRQALGVSDSDFGAQDMPRFPYIPIGLYLGTVALAKRQGIETLFMLTETRLVEHFSKLGVKLTPMGDYIEHRGARIPSMMNVDEIVKNLRRFVRPIWDTINTQIDASYEARRSTGHELKQNVSA